MYWSTHLTSAPTLPYWKKYWRISNLSAMWLRAKKKWISLTQEMMYLGYKITAAGIFPGLEKVQVMEVLSISPYWCSEAPSNWIRFEKHREKTLASII